MYKFVYNDLMKQMGIKLTEAELRICKAVILGHLNAIFIGKRAYDMLTFCNHFLRGIDITHVTCKKLNEYFKINHEHLLFIKDSNLLINKDNAVFSKTHSNTQIIIANIWGRGTRKWVNEIGFVQSLINKSFVVYDTNSLFEDENFARFDINDEKEFKENIPRYIIRNATLSYTCLLGNYIKEYNFLNIKRLAKALAEVDSIMAVTDEYYEEAKKYMLVEHELDFGKGE